MEASGSGTSDIGASGIGTARAGGLATETKSTAASAAGRNLERRIWKPFESTTEGENALVLVPAPLTGSKLAPSHFEVPTVEGAPPGTSKSLESAKQPENVSP